MKVVSTKSYRRINILTGSLQKIAGIITKVMPGFQESYGKMI